VRALPDALRLRPAPSAVVAHVGCKAVEGGAHHTILFGNAWEKTFDDIIRTGRPMTDPSLLVTRPTASDPSLAPPGRDLLYILAPTPNLARGQLDWDATADSYAAQMLDIVRARLPGVGDDAELLHVVTPADWARQGMLAGTPFALAHTFSQTGPFRLANAVLAGSSTVPGVGVPTALVSGRLAADRITGPLDARPVRAVSALEGRSA
jgi:phytoene desaturase